MNVIFYVTGQTNDLIRTVDTDGLVLKLKLGGGSFVL